MTLTRVKEESPPTSQEYQCHPEQRRSQISREGQWARGKQREQSQVTAVKRPSHPMSMSDVSKMPRKGKDPSRMPPNQQELRDPTASQRLKSRNFHGTILERRKLVRKAGEKG